MTIENLYVPQEGMLSDLRAWIAGDLGGGYARLFTNFVAPAPNLTPADFTEAAWAGYSPVHPLGWGVPFINLGGIGETDSGVLTWTFTGGSGSVINFGIYVTDPLSTEVLLWVPFATPVILAPAQPSVSRVIQATARSAL